MWKIPCKKLNSSNHRLNTKNQSLSSSSFFNTAPKLRIMELHYKLFTELCDVNEEMELDTDLLYLALAEKKVEDWIRPEMTMEWRKFQSNESVESFTADTVANFFPRTPNLCKSVARINGSHIYRYLMCQTITIGL